MSAAKHRAEVYIQPKNRRPLTRTADLTWTTPAEFRKKLEAYAATVWISARKIFVDTSSKEILVDGTAVANYAVHTPGTPAPATPAVPTVPIRRAHGRAYTRHTLTQLAVVALGLALTLASGALNGLYLGGFALAGFGLYRLGLGIDRREALK